MEEQLYTIRCYRGSGWETACDSGRQILPEEDSRVCYYSVNFHSLLTVGSGEELLGILSDPTNLTDSPELGPPPVAHFDHEDPVKYDTHRWKSPQSPLKEGMEPEASLDLPFSNLETRKKRRESGATRAMGSSTTQNSAASLQESSSSILPIPQPLKSGAKRKLSVRDDDDRCDMPAPSDKDGFRFNRRPEAASSTVKIAIIREVATAGNVAGRKVSQDLATARGQPREKVRDSAAAMVSRKALGESKMVY